MAGKIFVQAIRDRYKNSSSDAFNDPEGQGITSGAPFIRRPTNGIQIKEDTFATIRVVAADRGKNKLLVDAGSRRKQAGTNDYMQIDEKRATDIYSNFLLQQVQEDRQEKQQILETFGEAYIFLFGQRARVINFQGILANTADFNWEAEWWHNYDEYLRGTKCVENDARVYISYDNTLVGGYIISTSSSKDTMNKNHVSFQFQLFVTFYSNFSSVGDPSAYFGDGYHALSAEGNVTLSAGELDQYRPLLLPDKIPYDSGPLVGNGVVVNLFDAVEKDLAKVQNAWGQASQVVNSAIDKFSGFMNPDGGVRVPVGFAGSLVFRDETTLITQHESKDSTVRYTTFADNDAEYVGVSDHYGGSTLSLNEPALIGESRSALSYSQTMVDMANAEWKKAGFDLPDTQLGPVSKFLVSKALGMYAAGATSAWQTSNTALQAGSANPANFAHAAIPVDAHAAVPIE